jgi:hypothetical protein
MKLLRNFHRLCAAGFRTVSGRGTVASRGFRVTVPAALSQPAGQPTSERAVVIELPRAAPSSAVRREPASFLKAPRHRRLGAGRG